MYLGVVRCRLLGCRRIGILFNIGHVPRRNIKNTPPEKIVELVPMVIGEVIPEVITELNLSCEGGVYQSRKEYWKRNLWVK